MQESYKFGYWGETSEEILRARFPLHRACRDGDAEVLSLLLVEAQHGIYEEDNFYGWTPAHWASYFGKLACLRKLLATTRLGVNSNIRTSRFRQTPAHLAAFGGHPQCLLWLVSAEAELSAQDYLGETAVHKAARTGSMECISLLVSHGAKLFICNNNGQTAAQLASLCGYMECSRYLEEAAQCQDNQPKGVYQKTPPLNAITTPSPADVTTSKGLNGGRLPPPGPHGDMAMSEDCMMEEDSMEPQGVTAPSAAGDSVTDIMLDHGVSANTIAIGGRKRCREDGEEVDHKRRRSEHPAACNGAMAYGFTNTFSQGVAWADGVAAESKRMSDEVDYSVGYDYSGIPQFADENEDPNPLQQARLLECEQLQQVPAKCLALTGHYI